MLGALGGVSTVAWFVAKLTTEHKSKKWLQSHKSELDTELATHKGELSRETERHKLMFKRQELMFERELLAAEVFYRVYDSIWPVFIDPEDDYLTLQTQIAINFSNYGKKLEKIIFDHSVAISETALDFIKEAQVKTTEGDYIIALETGGESYEPEGHASEPVCKVVDEFVHLMREARKQIQIDLKIGSMADIEG